MSPGSTPERFRDTWCEVDLDAIRHNVRTLIGLAQSAELLAVVKANAYGHGAVPVARAAIDAGAQWLGVALVEEGMELRDAGIGEPILLLSEPPPAAAAAVVSNGLTPVVYTSNGIEALAKAVADSGAEPLAVHVKVDTGMHRVGCAPDDVLALVESIRQRSELVLGGICTHLAVADQSEHPYNAEQLDRFDAVLDGLHAGPGVPPLVHAANSAGVITHPRARYNLVRSGLAMYGIAPAPDLAERVHLKPAMSIKAHVSHVKALPAGSGVSYGLRYTLPADSHIATVPIGYADGVPRNLGLTGGEVLIGGRRYPIAGAVTMDQLLVDLGASDTALGEASPLGEVVTLIGEQGDERITATDWAEQLGIIPYEVTCGIGPRVPRVYMGVS